MYWEVVLEVLREMTEHRAKEKCRNAYVYA